MKILFLLLLAWTIASIFVLIRLHYKIQKKEKLDEEIKCQNMEAKQLKNKLSQEISNKREELERVKDDIETQNNIVKSLAETAENMRISAETHAQESYKLKLSELSAEYEKEKQRIASDLYQCSLVVQKEEKKVEDLKAKQLAYIQAQQRQLEMETQKDFYRLDINDDDKSDIMLLREIQNRFVKKEAIDKLIWEVYFKKPYDTLMSHLSLASSKKSGIYKITSLTTNQAYIGQSTDLRERLKTHIKSALSSAPASNKLYQAMKKYGPEDFTFEILEEISKDKLNEREKYWIEFYKTKESGLNGTKGGS